MRNRFFLSAILLALAGTAVHADDGLRPLCPDRPGKGTGTCTVDAGHLQIELGIYDFAHQSDGGVTDDDTTLLSPLIRYGLSDSFDIEVGLAPFNRTHTRDTLAGTTLTEDGFGDMTLRAKWNVTGYDGDFSAAVEPYVKIPTAAHGIGNGAVEGGLIVPLSYALGGDWSLADTAETDTLKNASSGGTHVAFSNTLGIGYAFASGFSAGAEFWDSHEFDPAGITSQYSADLWAAWVPDSLPDIQFDGGINFGLNAATPDAEYYVGISKRF